MQQLLRYSDATVNLSRSQFSVSLRSLLYGLLLGGSSAVAANPYDGNVVGGSATISGQNTSVVTINQSSQRAVINWQGFSIAPGEQTRFIQPSETSVALNRITGGIPSVIAGQLDANGHVMLVNPNGIVITNSGVISTASFTASIADVPTTQFMAGQYHFEQAGDPQASIVNEGTITLAEGGLATLVAPTVRNSGVINARLGKVQLASAETFTLDLHGDGLINLAVSSAQQLHIENSGTLQADGGTVHLTTAQAEAVVDSLINTSGIIQANTYTEVAGVVRLVGDTVLNTGTLSAHGDASQHGGTLEVTGNSVNMAGTVDVSGDVGGAVDIQSRGLVNLSGNIIADGNEHGGTVVIAGEQIYQNTRSEISADSNTGDGGTVSVQAAAHNKGLLLASGSVSATGERGGQVQLFGNQITLWGTDVDVSGKSQGGTLLAGGDFQGTNSAVANAETVLVTQTTRLRADANETGNGGKLIVWSDLNTRFYGFASARGGALSGNGGLIEVSGKESLHFGGSGDAGANQGLAGTLLLDPRNIVIEEVTGLAFNKLFSGVVSLEPGSQIGADLSTNYYPLKGDNFLITAAYLDDPFVDIGGFFTFNAFDGLLNAVTGSLAGDAVSSGGVLQLGNDNVLVNSPGWFGGRGAVTWVDGTTGMLADFGNSIDSSNSVIGTAIGDNVGSGGITLVGNHKAIITSPEWNSARGAATWIDGATGLLANGTTGGEISTLNSLTGSAVNNRVGDGGVTALSNGHALVVSPLWDNGATTNVGAVTWFNGSLGMVGTVTATNSLVGTTAEDRAGSGGVLALSNGNAIIISTEWFGPGYNPILQFDNIGAVTWMNGSNGTLFGGSAIGAITTANSITGGDLDERIGSGGAIEVGAGNALILSPESNISRGAITWINGMDGRMAEAGDPAQVRSENSMTGTDVGDRVGSGGAVVLENGNALVLSPEWNDDRGAVTWINGVDGSNTLEDLLGLLPPWANGFYGNINTENSLVGQFAGDSIGSGGIVQLGNGNVIILSPDYDDQRGAVTWLEGATGLLVLENEFQDPVLRAGAELQSNNSITGFTPGDRIGETAVTLGNGNVIIVSPGYEIGDPAGPAGAVIWINGADGTVSNGSPAHSSFSGIAGFTFFGKGGDALGSGGAYALANGNAVILNPDWDYTDFGTVTDAGSVLWINGNNGLTIDGSGIGNSGGLVSTNQLSLFGTTNNDRIGSHGAAVLTNGNVLIVSPDWDSLSAVDAGAVTWINGADGTLIGGFPGEVDTFNSLTGTHANDSIGSGGVLALSNGNAIVLSPEADAGNIDAGVVTWINGGNGDAINSLVGIGAGDQIGSGGVFEIANGNAVVVSPLWDFEVFSPVYSVVADVGAVTWIDGATGKLADGATGDFVNTNNSVIGETANDQLGSGGVVGLADGSFLISSPLFDDFAVDTGEVHLVRAANGLAPDLMVYGYHPDENVTISPRQIEALLGTGTNLVMQANNDITLSISNQIFVDNLLGNGGALTLQAGRSIIFESGTHITTDNGDLMLYANDLLANGVVDFQRLDGNAVINLSGSIIDAGTGTVTIELRDGAGKSFTESGDITLGVISAAELFVTNAGTTVGSDILQAGTLTVTGDASFSATGNISLEDALNDFQGTVTLAGREVKIYDKNFLTLAETGTNVLQLDAEAGFELRLLGGTFDTRAGVEDSQVLGRVLLDAEVIRLFGDTVIQTRQQVSLNADITGPGSLIIEHDHTDDSLPDTNEGGFVSINGLLGAPVSLRDADGICCIGIDATEAALAGLSITTTEAFTFEENVFSASSILAVVGNNLSIYSSTLSAEGTGDAIVLSTTGAFENFTGNTVLNAVNGRWLVYSHNPTDSTENGLTAEADTTTPRFYNRTYAANAPATIAAGNHLIYAFEPTLDVTGDNDSRVYGDANPVFTTTITGGFVNDDGVEDSAANADITGAPASSATASSNVSGSPYAITQGTYASDTGYAINFTNGELTITARPVTVTADAGQTKVYGNADPGTYTYTNTSLGSGTALSGALTRNAGEDVDLYAITQGTLNNTSNSNYNITYAGDNFSITQRDVTVTADAGQSKVYGNSDPVAYTYTNTSLGSGVALSGVLTRDTGEDVDLYAITQGTLNNTSNSNYNLTYIGNNFSITQRDVTVTADAGQTRVYGNADPGAYTYTNTSLGSGAALSGALTRDTGEDVALYAITQGTLNNSSNPNYNLTYIGNNFSITPRDVTVTADAGQTKIYGNADPGVYTYTNTSLGSGAALSGALTRDTGEDVDLYAITQGTLNNTSNSNYNITYTGDNFSITPRDVTVTADAGQSKVYGNSDPVAYTYTNTSLGNGVALSGALSRDTGEDVDLYAITQGTLNNTSNSNYNITYAGDNFSITQRDVTVTADAGQSKVYGDSNPVAYTYTNTSLGSGVALSGVLTRDTGEDVDLYAITQGTLNNTSNSNYNITYAGDNFSITTRSVTVTADAGQSKVYGNVDPHLTYIVGGMGLVNLDVLAGSLVRTAGENVNTYAIGQGTLDNISNVNYSITYIANDFSITQRSITVNVDAGQTKIYGDADPLLTYTVGGMGLVNMDELPGSLTRTPGENVNTYAISQGTLIGGANYNITAFTGNMFLINPAMLLIAADNKTRKVGEENPLLTASFTGLVNQDTELDITGLTLTTQVSTDSIPGNYAITAAGATSPDYSISFINGTLKVLTGRNALIDAFIDWFIQHQDDSNVQQENTDHLVMPDNVDEENILGVEFNLDDDLVVSKE